MSSRESWAYLSRVVEGPSKHLSELLNKGHAAAEIAEGVRRRESWIGPLLGETESRYSWDRAQEDLEQIAALGGRLITREDAEWPEAAFSQAFGFAASGVSEHLRTYRSDAVEPHALWVRGAPLAPLLAQSVAVVGTRAQSRYGVEVTRQLVAGLVAHQWTVVSGGALGIDTEAHRTALDQGGATVMVAACGLDHSYPARNGALFERIAEQGSVVSEYPPGVTPQRHRFLTRNRLVAAMTGGTVIVEAAWRSGALNTLSWASALGKVAMAVPGPVTSANSLGCHERIRDGRAQLVTGSDDVRELLGALGEVDVAAQYELMYAGTPVQQLSHNELKIFDCLEPDAEVETEVVAAAAGLPLALTVHLLVDLSKRGLVRRSGTSWARGESA
ncbi:hypothetical protein COCCU_08895 [Corynebacterium occultum]|uniref:Smf/DprA SLOG domain-containing protein n=1 Tax=Corynebacterium occultum TaxID=2675219 RepID=A0A6B8VU26_9CORY|nr:DNA-processing protein DprA [Corynebacterium occultum]QGU07703.1 hypothetical protein COCCU_08895 [Corynebacterium occultum]